jgi:hypothetical protein
MILSIMAVSLCSVSFMLSVTNKPFMLSVIMLNVGMLNGVAPQEMAVNISHCFCQVAKQSTCNPQGMGSINASERQNINKKFKL